MTQYSRDAPFPRERAQLFVVHVLSMLPVILDAYVAPTVWGGSVAARDLATARCPILTVRA